MQGQKFVEEKVGGAADLVLGNGANGGGIIGAIGNKLDAVTAAGRASAIQGANNMLSAVGNGLNKVGDTIAHPPLPSFAKGKGAEISAPSRALSKAPEIEGSSSLNTNAKAQACGELSNCGINKMEDFQMASSTQFEYNAGLANNALATNAHQIG